MSLKDQVAIVTGASSGIGRSIALNLAKEQAKVVVNYNSSEEKAQNLVDEIKALGTEAIMVKANVGKFDEAKFLIEETVKAYGKVDILVNNAGITKDTLMLRMKEEEFDQVIEINLKGAWNCCKHVSRRMSKQRTGKIINIASIVAHIGNIGQTNYVASKAGVIGLTKSLARELATRNVTVNAVAPGFIQTKMTENLSDEIIESYQKNIPLSRLGNPEDIANLVTFLCSEKANYITGQVINVDGGLVMN
ncbi:3-oxoacyl-[acyl-carrier-protein] reductase [Haloplasma contractile]|uniref:3-oxoacyl-[acyl-carrier-protein] reductase n=1 Tax=Haloplasma contractile SSD-17B TaxID=1033810 RepID=U2E9A9_9MOLU|nr:3-oxoacyl-[acyl-carrier-protein] reductase [Haloplasma contractile]ERJ11446.1 3-ketoacyl-acyl carrier protein reductase [Haloplasma contractile SSD-17B]